jgi:hypothetical protein
MLKLPVMDSKTTILVLAFLSAILIGAVLGLPYFKEGLATPQYSETAKMDNDGANLGEPLPWAEGDVSSELYLKNVLKTCKDACTKFGESCLGFTHDMENKQCTLKSSKGNDVPAEKIGSFWKSVAM